LNTDAHRASSYLCYPLQPFLLARLAHLQLAQVICAARELQNIWLFPMLLTSCHMLVRDSFWELDTLEVAVENSIKYDANTKTSTF